MTKAGTESLADLDYQGIVVMPTGMKTQRFGQVKIYRSSHPYPGRGGLIASQATIEAIHNLSADDLLICLISGGASAMLPAPADGITLQDKVQLTKLLIRTNATIHEINTVRRHISILKGGRLVETCPARILSLIISDVAGNRLEDIGSGLTAPDPTSYGDSIGILKRHHVWTKTPSTIREHLVSGLKGRVPETPKPHSQIFRRVRNVIVADNRVACNAAERFLAELKIRTRIMPCPHGMSARGLGKLLADLAQEAETRPAGRAVIVGGETTVEVTGYGIGGRNQEAVLAAVPGISGLNGRVIAALGTDGIDGNSPAAGAIADPLTYARAKRLGLKPRVFLTRNDSYRFFKRLNDNLFTGPTGTNVGDVYVMLRLERHRGPT